MWVHTSSEGLVGRATRHSISGCVDGSVLWTCDPRVTRHDVAVLPTSHEAIAVRPVRDVDDVVVAVELFDFDGRLAAVTGARRRPRRHRLTPHTPRLVTAHYIHRVRAAAGLKSVTGQMLRAVGHGAGVSSRTIQVYGWRHGIEVVERVTEATLRRTRSVLRWVTAFVAIPSQVHN